MTAARQLIPHIAYPSAAEVRLRSARLLAGAEAVLMRSEAHNWRLWRSVSRDPLGCNKKRARQGMLLALKAACVHRARRAHWRAEVARLETAQRAVSTERS